ncbi:hypothetical protein PG994_005184 [Apiospora phragmitis]|uniref:Uncharacterized protein n=1 Tax=Apiospora phragmitis TaxID=2905665 RepID=A0ABR1VVT3_9PEZI
MPVTIKVANHEANLIYRPQRVDSPESLLGTLHGDDSASSLEGDNLPPVLLAHKNGFVNAATTAYSRHHHLAIRPEDIWLAIISQFSIYINKHAEELRGQFVAHAGQKELKIVYENATRHTVDFADFARQIRGLISESVVDDEHHDGDNVVVAHVMMMGTLQAYFRYAIPSVTLLGTKQDYEEILRRLDRRARHGEEPGAFSDLLRPVVRCLIRGFDEPGHPDVRSFWEKICDEHHGSGFSYYTGSI